MHYWSKENYVFSSVAHSRPSYIFDILWCMRPIPLISFTAYMNTGCCLTDIHHSPSNNTWAISNMYVKLDTCAAICRRIVASNRFCMWNINITRFLPINELATIKILDVKLIGANLCAGATRSSGFRLESWLKLNVSLENMSKMTSCFQVKNSKILIIFISKYMTKLLNVGRNIGLSLWILK